VRPFLIVIYEPVVRDPLDLTDGRECVSVEHFLAVGPVEPLDEGVLIGLPGLDIEKIDTMLVAPVYELLSDLVLGRYPGESLRDNRRS